MSELNRHLLRQIRRKLGGLDNLPAEMYDLIEAVSKSYDHYERDRMLLERAMELSSEELRDSYEKLATQVELNRVNKEMEQFAMVASHDLKEPLRTIASYTFLLESSLNGSANDTSKEYMIFIRDGVSRMTNLLESLLKYASLGKAYVSEEKISLNEILLFVQKNLRRRIEDNGARIQVGDLPSVFAFPAHMVQLFQNLISNAIKFRSKADPEIIVDSSSNEEFHTIWVQDNGIGVKPEFQDSIFRLFQRVNPHAIEGTGIGLAVCKKIVTELGGSIHVESEPGKGARFVVLLPVRNS